MKRLIFTPRQEGTFGLYLASIRHTKLLSDVQVRELLRTYRQTGDITARNRVITANTLYVVSVAKEYLTPGIDIQDLIQEGNLGLIEAVEHFDTDAPAPFIIYATFWVRKYISKFLHSYRYCVTTPASFYGEIFVNSINVTNIPQDDDSPSPENHIPALQSEQQHCFCADEQQQAVALALATLRDDESQVLRLTFGIDCQPCSDTQIMRQLAYRTTERVRQVRELALRKLYSRLLKKRSTSHFE